MTSPSLLNIDFIAGLESLLLGSAEAQSWAEPLLDVQVQVQAEEGQEDPDTREAQQGPEDQGAQVEGGQPADPGWV